MLVDHEQAPVQGRAGHWRCVPWRGRRAGGPARARGDGVVGGAARARTRRALRWEPWGGRVTLQPVPALALHHVAIQCHDLDRCERFYRDVLGLPVLRRWPREGGGDRSVWLALDGGFLALERADHPPEDLPWRDGRPGLHLVALRIGAGERVGWEDRLRAHDVPVVHRTRWTLYVRDPEGNRIGLSHHPDDAPAG